MAQLGDVPSPQFYKNKGGQETQQGFRDHNSDIAGSPFWPPIMMVAS